jgi:glutamate formiminotransferase / 5-formyltetrahydrofolate cyclo-ligase
VRLMECVPNVSEGRDPVKVEAIVAEVRNAPGVILLGSSSDPDHNRSVISYLGEPEAVLSATVALCLKALEVIDMRLHTGGHPRLGAVDVIPFVPLGGVTVEEAVSVARSLGERLGAAGVPVYYYEEAALRPERRNLADVRRGEYEALQERLSTEAGRPDAGPSEFNPRTGASIVGVRKPLIAFNVNLGTDRLEVAEAIARAVRLSSGGYRGVKALGVALPAKGQVQVSMNLVDYESTPIHRVVETVRFEAARYGVPITECELVGLAPLAAFEETIRFYLQIHGFSITQIIEAHLL